MNAIKEILKDESAVVIDVRNDWEFEEGHINGALHIPLHEIPVHINKMKSMKGPFVLYCRSGNRSAVAVNTLKQAGINNAYNGGSIFDLQKLVLN